MAEIRTYSPADYPQVRRNLEEADIFYDNRDTQENYDALAESDSGVILVADVKGEVAGSVVAQQFGVSLAHMWSMAVAEKYRRQGIGTELALTAADVLKDMGVREVWGFVNIKNLASIALVRKFGFKINEDNMYFGPWKMLDLLSIYQ